MKVGLVLPANILHAPYLEYYTEILDDENINYNIIYWNKVNLDENVKNSIAFNHTCSYDSGNVKKLIGYYLFSRFVIREIKRRNYDKLIILVPQIGLFLANYLEKHYKNNYILDIRDYSKMNRFAGKYNAIIKNSNFTVISSEGYRKWLPSFDRYTISHNVFINRLQQVEDLNSNLKNKNEIVFSNIGSIRHYEENIKILDMFKNSTKFQLRYIGTGICEKDLELYCVNNKINNVYFHGRYSREEELDFYYKSDLINLIMPTKDLGPQTSMSNRLYNACVAKRPVIISNNSYMSNLVQEYNLGLVVDIESDNLEEKINSYISSFNYETYKLGCIEFLNRVQIEEEKFKNNLKQFLVEQAG
ncbi:glycosyltransferase [Mesobacillus selenatarsenatis]|uniref:Capsular polysaccharide biosynthesis protein Cps4G n=1 Tax=Mesobacillus selenatarsenatis (strain DSM 18680 / JCM 14380 / FERM P-15431 / SF-1) TaxID=1321606 RepID=A0A0A8XDJ6_MESS1|nr:glycosyltransferase [Mesobacillus selenatarsenatis]GAM16236.1 capsular polysaccharide biosynthesis protein Cps4G [Mesobacillus selenatarsenatis SF-1]